MISAVWKNAQLHRHLSKNFSTNFYEADCASPLKPFLWRPGRSNGNCNSAVPTGQQLCCYDQELHCRWDIQPTHVFWCFSSVTSAFTLEVVLTRVVVVLAAISAMDSWYLSQLT